MAVELVSSSKGERTIGTLEDGKIAVITSGKHIGEVVQRYGDSCISIGKKYGHGWTGCGGNSIKVRVLEEGEIIKIIDN